MQLEKTEFTEGNNTIIYFDNGTNIHVSTHKESFKKFLDSKHNFYHFNNDSQNNLSINKQRVMFVSFKHEKGSLSTEKK